MVCLPYTYHTTVDKVFGMATGLGNIMFAFGYSLVLIEISETVKEPAQATMRKAVRVSAVVFALCVNPHYCCVWHVYNTIMFFPQVLYNCWLHVVRCTGQHRQSVCVVHNVKTLCNLPCQQDNVLLSYSEPVWLLVVANLAVFVHLLPAFQVFAQSNYAALEAAVAHTKYSLNQKSRVRRAGIRLAYRGVYVLLATTIAALIPVCG